jgi:hypothetical protein
MTTSQTPAIPTTPTPAPKKQSRWPYVAMIAGALLIGIGLGSSSHGTAPTTAAAPAATYSAPAYVPDNPAVPAPTYAPSGPLTTFADGIYDVGTGPGEIPPGKYKSANETGDGSVFVKESADRYGDYATGKGQLIVTVTKADVEVEVRDATFTKM